MLVDGTPFGWLIEKYVYTHVYVPLTNVPITGLYCLIANFSLNSYIISNKYWFRDSFLNLTFESDMHSIDISRDAITQRPYGSWPHEMLVISKSKGFDASCAPCRRCADIASIAKAKWITHWNLNYFDQYNNISLSRSKGFLEAL